MRPTKDYGRQAVYRAEQIAFPEWSDVKLTRAEALAMVAETHRLHGDGKSLPVLEFGDGHHGGGYAISFARRIVLHDGHGTGVSPFLVLHEIAHVYTAGDPGHGPAWRRRYLALILAMIGTAEAKRLADAFAAERVPADAAASAPAYRKRTRPNRKFRYEISIVDVSRAVSKTVGNVTTWSGIEWGPWQPCDKENEHVRGLSAHDVNAMRNGTVWFRGSVRLPGPEGNCGNSYSRAKVRMVQVRKG